MLNESLGIIGIIDVNSAINNDHIEVMFLLEQKSVMRYDSDTMCHM